MNISTFKKLSENGPVNRYVGEIFLEGEHIIGQKQTKDVGDFVTYYEIVKLINDGRYEYELKYEILVK